MRVFADSLAEMWSSARRRTWLSSDEAAAERLLAAWRLDCEAPASERTLELVLAAAAGPATERELAGEWVAVTAFLAALEPERAPRLRPRRVPVLAIAVALIAVVALCGTAEAGALPAPLQLLAHRTIDAPAPAPSPAIRGLPPTGHVTPGPGGTGSHKAPATHHLVQQSPAPSASPNPAHTGKGKGNDKPGTPGRAADRRNSAGDGKGTGKGRSGTTRAKVTATARAKP